MSDQEEFDTETETEQEIILTAESLSENFLNRLSHL